MEKKEKSEKKASVEGLPIDTSPYTQYKDLEDYKNKGYDTEGHLKIDPGRGAAASTDAPTLTGGAAADPKAKKSSTDFINRQGVP